MWELKKCGLRKSTEPKVLIAEDDELVKRTKLMVMFKVDRKSRFRRRKREKSHKQY